MRVCENMKYKKKQKEKIKQPIEFSKIAKFVIPVGKENAKIIAKALKVETKEFPQTKVKVKTKNENLILEIFARDTSSLRAVINSYLRWILMAEEIIGRYSDFC